MKKNLFLLVAALFAGIYSFSQNVPTEKTLLWQISGKGIKTSYVFGTTHQICKEDFIWTPAMENALAASEQVCMEMDMDDPATMMTVAQGMMNTDGKKLRDYFTDKEYEALGNYVAEKTTYRIEMFEMMKPIALISLLIENSVTCDALTSYEGAIGEMAKEQKKEIVGIETPKEQIDALNAVNMDSIKFYLMEVVNGSSAGTDEMSKIIELYKKQDIAGLQSFIEQSSAGNMGGMEALLPDRNKRWIPRIEKMSQEKSTFYAVGAGHLAGKEGVLYLLRKQGYKVVPIF